MDVHVCVMLRVYNYVSYLSIQQNFVKNSCNVWDQGTLEGLWAVFNTEPPTDATKGGSAEARLEEEKPAEAQKVSTDSKLANGVSQSLSPTSKKEKKKRDKMAPTIDASVEQNGEQNGGESVEISRVGKKKRKNTSTDAGHDLEQNGELAEPSKEKRKKAKTEDLIESSVDEEKTSSVPVNVENAEPSRETKKKKRTSAAIKDSQNGELVESSGRKERKKKKSRQTEDILTCTKRDLEAGLAECEPHKHKKRKMTSAT